MVSSSSHGVSASLVTSCFAMQQVAVLSASHGPVAGSRRLGYQPFAPICVNVIVAPCDGGSCSDGSIGAGPRPPSTGGSGDASSVGATLPSCVGGTPPPSSVPEDVCD